MVVSRRPVVDSDEPLLRALYAASREFELSHVAFSPEQKEAFLAMQFDAQRRHYLATYPHGEHEIISMDDTAIGRIWHAEQPDEIRIMDITLLPEWRGRGAGAHVLRELIARAEALGKPVRIWVETWNPSKQILQYLGFAEIKADGINVLLERKTKATAS